MSLQTRPGRPGEWQEILDLSHTAFGTDADYFPNRYPHAYPGAEAAENFIVCEDGGELLGVVNQTPVTLRVGAARLQAAGIGGVCTLPQARGRGVMSAMLRASRELQRRRGTHVGFLWGYRERYRRYGFERAGRQLNAHLERKDLAAADARPLRRLERGEADALLPLVGRLRASVQRERAWLAALLQREQFAVWVTGTPPAAYLVCPAGAPAGPQCELGGDPDALPGLLKAHLEAHSLDAAGILLCPGTPGHDALATVAESASLHPATQVAIYDFPRFLAAVVGELAPALRRRGAGPLTLHHRGEGATVELRPAGEGAAAVQTVDAGPDEADLALSGPQWVQAFFPSPVTAAAPVVPEPRLAAALALPLVLPPWDHL